MFHTYITAASGSKVDIDRATFLMDKGLFTQIMEELYYSVLRDINEHYDEPFDQACATDIATHNLPQRVWAQYCERHYEKYGKPFLPDTKRDWDK